MTLPVRFRDCKSRHDSAILVERQSCADLPNRCTNSLLGPSTRGHDSIRTRSRIGGQRHQYLSRYSLRGVASWRAPQSTETWTAVRRATTAGSSYICTRGMSLEIGGGPSKLDEDCLGLNVFGPRVERTAQLPVMVWIHGAALIFW